MFGPRTAIILVSAVLLAGCAGDTDSTGQANPSASFDPDAGIIHGIVTDDALAPIAAAQVLLDGATEVLTDDAGSYSFQGVAPGPHVVTGAAFGFQGATTQVEVVAGAPVTANLLLLPVGTQAPYYATFHETGLIGCAASSPQLFFTVLTNCETFYIAGAHDIDNYIVPFDLGSLAGITGFWSETVWQSTQAFGKSMEVQWTMSGESVPEQNTYVVYAFAEKTGTSPVRFSFPISQLVDNLTTELGPSDLCTMDKCTIIGLNYAGNDSFDAGGAAQFGLMVQQRYEQYLTAFYNGPLPAEFAIVPDQ